MLHSAHMMNISYKFQLLFRSVLEHVWSPKQESLYLRSKNKTCLLKKQCPLLPSRVKKLDNDVTFLPIIHISGKKIYILLCENHNILNPHWNFAQTSQDESKKKRKEKIHRAYPEAVCRSVTLLWAQFRVGRENSVCEVHFVINEGQITSFKVHR